VWRPGFNELREASARYGRALRQGEQELGKAAALAILKLSPLTRMKKNTVAALALGVLLILVGAFLQQDGILTTDPLAYLILVLTSSVLILHRIRKRPLSDAADVGGTWLAVGLAVAAALSAFASPIGGGLRLTLVSLSVALLALSLVARLLGPRLVAQLAVPILVIYVLVPLLPLFEAALSYPVRRLSAILAAGALSIGPAPVALAGTELSWGDLRVGVTSACSGLTLLQNLIWVAWWVVVLRHQGLWTRFAHGLLVVPAVVAANTLRVIGLAVMASLFGEQTLTGMGHVVIGWLAVALAAIMFLAMEQLFSATAMETSTPAAASGG